LASKSYQNFGEICGEIGLSEIRNFFSDSRKKVVGEGRDWPRVMMGLSEILGVLVSDGNAYQT